MESNVDFPFPRSIMYVFLEAYNIMQAYASESSSSTYAYIACTLNMKSKVDFPFPACIMYVFWEFDRPT